MGERPKLSVVIPVYNERSTIREVLRQVFALPVDKEVIIVDDGSSDGTAEILRREYEGKFPQVKVRYSFRNMGKGAALRAGFSEVTGELVSVQDADLEYDPAELLSLMEPLLRGEADAVYGSRFIGGKRRLKGALYAHYLGNWFLTFFTNLLYGSRLTDMETCYKVFRADALEWLQIEEDGFSVEPEITARLLRRGMRIRELPISYRARSYDQGKKIKWRDGFSALRALLKYRIVSLR